MLVDQFTKTQPYYEKWFKLKETGQEFAWLAQGLGLPTASKKGRTLVIAQSRTEDAVLGKRTYHIINEFASSNLTELLTRSVDYARHYAAEPTHTDTGNKPLMDLAHKLQLQLNLFLCYLSSTMCLCLLLLSLRHSM